MRTLETIAERAGRRLGRYIKDDRMLLLNLAAINTSELAIAIFLGNGLAALAMIPLTVYLFATVRRLQRDVAT